jgi:hypothetical protein
VDAFTVATDLFGDLQLTSGQLAQLRAINHKYWQEVYTLLHPAGGDAKAPGPPDGGPTPSEPASLTERQTAALRAMLEKELRAILTPEQRAALDGIRGR